MIRPSLLLAASAFVLLSVPARAATQQQTLQGKQVELDDLFAALTVKIDPAAQGVQVSAEGPDDYVGRLTFTTEGDKAIVRLRPQAETNWTGDQPPLTVTVTIAPGTPLAIGGFIGKAAIGDLNAPFSLDAVSGTVTAGSVTNASIQSSGSADVALGTVSGALSFQSEGSGSLKSGAAGATALSMSGSGNADIASVKGDLAIQIEGSGVAKIGDIESAAALSTSGSGEIKIHGGRASAFQASADGSGDITFGGTAVSPMISASGSGSVCIGAVEGQLTSDGGNVKIDPKACVPS